MNENPSLSHRLVKNELQVLLEVFARRKMVFISTFIVIPMLAVVYLKRQTPVYEASMSMSLTKDNQAMVMPTESNNSGAPADKTRYNIQDHLDTLKNDRALFMEVRETLKEAKSPLGALPVEELMSWVDAQTDGTGGNLIEVLAYANAPEDAAQLANTVARIYIKQNLNRREEGIRRARRFIETQLENVKQELFVDQKQLSALGLDADPTDSGAKRNLGFYLDDLEAEEGRIRSAIAMKQRQKAQLQGRFNQLRRSPSSKGSARPAAPPPQSSERFNALREQLKTLDADYFRESQKFTSKAAHVQRIGQQIEELKAEIAAIEPPKPEAVEQVSQVEVPLDYNAVIRDLNDLDNQIASLAVDLEAVNSRMSKYADDSNPVPPEAIVSYDSLKSRVEINRELFRLYQMKLNDFQIMETMNLGDVRELAPAVGAKKVKPREAIVMIGALFFAFLFAATASSIADMADKRFLSEDEIVGYVQRPIIGTIPWRAKSGGASAFDYNMLDFQTEESYRTLAANIKFAELGKKKWALFITSSIAGEGKTTTACYLAQMLSKTGKTLLVDADFRKPSVHEALGLENEIGFTDVLVGEADMGQAVQRVTENLHVLSAGSFVSNLFSLLFESEQLQSLIAKFREEYKIVLFDTSPVGIVSDTIFLGNLLDGCLMIISPNECQKNMALNAINLLGRARVRVTGIVLNKLTPSKRNHYYYKYKYGGRYGYGGSSEKRKADKSAGKQETPAPKAKV